jgi:hypothetical protein
MKSILKQKHFESLFFIVSLTSIIFLATLPFWNKHLIIGAYYLYPSAQYFKIHHNLQHYTWIYDPGANLYFILLSLLMPTDSLSFFILAMFLVNLILIICMYLLITKSHFMKQKKIILSLLLFCLGPIVFFRFDTYVSVLFVISIFLFIKRSYTASFIFLTISILTKLYPIIFAPYFLFYLLKKSNLKTVFKQLLTMFVTLVAFLSCYVYFLKVTPYTIIKNLKHYTAVNVHTESVWGSIFTLFSYLKNGIFPHGTYTLETHTLPLQDTYIPMKYLSLFWIFAITFVYIFVFMHSKKFFNSFSVPAILALTTTLLATTKLLSPQYFIWYMFPLVFFINDKWNNDKKLIIAISCLICLLTQIVYPVNYNNWLYHLYIDGSYLSLYAINTLRNLLLLTLPILLIRYQLKHKENWEK